MANCIENNLWEFCKKILNYTENNDICLWGSFLLPHTVYLAFENFGTLDFKHLYDLYKFEFLTPIGTKYTYGLPLVELLVSHACVYSKWV